MTDTDTSDLCGYPTLLGPCAHPAGHPSEWHGRATPHAPDPDATMPPAGELLPAALGSTSSRHLFVADDDKLLVLADAAMTMVEADHLGEHLGRALNIDPGRIIVLSGVRDIITTSPLEVEEDAG